MFGALNHGEQATHVGSSFAHGVFATIKRTIDIFE